MIEVGSFYMYVHTYTYRCSKSVFPPSTNSVGEVREGVEKGWE